MAVSHIKTSIEGLLNMSDSKIGRLLEMTGKDARKELLSRQSIGHMYIPSDSCIYFDPKTGCECANTKKPPMLNG